MSELFSKLPVGTTHLKNYISEDHQAQLVDLCRGLLKTHPLMQPKTKTGFNLSLQVSSWGKYGWMAENGHYFYMERHHNSHFFPPIPKLVKDLMHFACLSAEMPPIPNLETVLLNWYPPGTGKLGRHQDVTEQDQESPIVTISLGDSCIFNIGTLDYEDKGIDIECRSGDVVVMGGPSRLAYHGVKGLIKTDNKLFPNGGRISLTGRQVMR